MVTYVTISFDDKTLDIVDTLAEAVFNGNRSGATKFIIREWGKKRK